MSAFLVHDTHFLAKRELQINPCRIYLAFLLKMVSNHYVNSCPPWRMRGNKAFIYSFFSCKCWKGKELGASYFFPQDNWVVNIWPEPCFSPKTDPSLTAENEPFVFFRKKHAPYSHVDHEITLFKLWLSPCKSWKSVCSHGFGVLKLPLFFLSPFHSVDSLSSTKWLISLIPVCGPGFLSWNVVICKAAGHASGLNLDILS